MYKFFVIPLTLADITVTQADRDLVAAENGCFAPHHVLSLGTSNPLNRDTKTLTNVLAAYLSNSTGQSQTIHNEL